jgi:hypothetical protein
LGVYKVVNKVDVLGFLKREVHAWWKAKPMSEKQASDRRNFTKDDTLD